MVKQQTTTQNDEVKELVVDARFFMDSYEKKDKDGNMIGNVEFVSFELINPFGDEDFSHVPLKARWDKVDGNNRVIRADRVFDYMKYYAKKALRTAEEVKVKVMIRPVTYKSKRSGKMVTYPGMFAYPTFIELADEKPVEVVAKGMINGLSAANIFGLLAGKALGITFTSNVDPDEDIGL